jgi:hypothetical protein
LFDISAVSVVYTISLSSLINLSQLPIMALTATGLLVQEWDVGLVDQELILNNIGPRALSERQIDDAMGLIVPVTDPEKKIEEGTFSGTQKALTEVYMKIEER